MKGINILHLSDIHFQKKEDEKNKAFRQDVQTKLVDAVKTHSKEHGDVNFVVVTGDIAFSGKKHQYDEALDFFGKLKAVLPGKTGFLPVPGNHDVDRSEVDPCFPVYENIIQKEKIGNFLQSEKHIRWTINSKFNHFREFARKLNPKLYPTENDYFWVRDFEDQKVSFLGLNSCWASGNDNEDLKIALGYPQLMKALAQSVQKNKILLMHHPMANWLEVKDFRRCEAEIFSNCGLVLHGHTHLDEARGYKDPSYSCICLGANASYTNDKEGFIGFQFIEVKFPGNGTTVTVWPYRLDSRTRIRFVPDTYRWEKQGGKPYFQLESIEHIEPGPPESKPLLPLEIPETYKEWVKEFHSTMDIDLLARKGEVITISLPKVYIPIETRNPFYKEEMEKEEIVTEGIIHVGAKIKHEKAPESKEPSYIDIEALMGRKKLILLRGGAGMGKTTLIKHLAYTITNGTRRDSLNDYLPVMVFLKELWLIYNEELQKTKKKILFEDLLTLYLEKSKCQLAWETVSRYLSHQKALFLIDGLDEVPEHLRADLLDIIAQFRFDNKQNRFLLTGRRHGIAGRAMALFREDLHVIEPVNDQMAADFILHWFRAISGQARGLGEVTAKAMISDIRQHERISIFTQNPLLLTAVCILYQDGKRIPDQRADLYNRVVDNLINRRFHDPAQPGKKNEVLEFLMRLAFESQVQNRKTIDVDHALEILKKTLPPKTGGIDSPYHQRIAAFFNEIEPGCGLFNRLSSGELEFTHLTFQEFLAAKYMVYMEIDCNQFLENEWWEEALLLYTGFMGIDRKRKSNDIAASFLSGKAGRKRDKRSRNRLILLAGRALCDLQPSKRDESVVSLACDRLKGLIESDAPLEERFQAGLLLGGLGDPRIDIQSPPMVHVEAGDFTRGAKENKREKPVRRIFLDEFMIGKYPVTNEEFKVFIHDNGYETEAFWTPEGWEWRKKKNILEPDYWHDRKWNGPNFPVVGVSWNEAVAYAKWLSAKTGDDYSLPTEAQWEKAARGPDGLTYPWGKKFDKNLCNSDESGLNRTSPVGIFPEGKSPYGCMDMAGNVWEWCADWFEEKYYKESPVENPQGPLDGSGRVLRGGGWVDGARVCRAAYRGADHPGIRWGGFGFRLVRSF